MSKKKKKQRSESSSSRMDHFVPTTDFYAGSPVEKPLATDRRNSDTQQVRRTERHQAIGGRRKEGVDPREKMALLAILKSAILILLLLIAFFALWKGVGFYEESRLISQAEEAEVTSVQEAVTLVEAFDITDQESREKFSNRIIRWQEADRLVRSSDALLQRNIYDQALLQCQDALAIDPSHRGALERCAQLHSLQGNHAAAVNAYVRLMSVDPSEKKVQRLLIEALDAFGDDKAVRYMARWYLDQNLYDAAVQQVLADSLYALDDFESALAAYDRLLRTDSENIHALEQRAATLMQLGVYEKALISLDRLHEYNLGNPSYYKRVVVCNAQLKKGKETVQALGKASHLFGEQVILEWLKDPQLDPVREDRSFQVFAGRVGGEEFRRWLEHVARSMDEGTQKKEIEPQLDMSMSEFEANELLNSRNR